MKAEQPSKKDLFSFSTSFQYSNCPYNSIQFELIMRRSIRSTKSSVIQKTLEKSLWNINDRRDTNFHIACNLISEILGRIDHIESMVKHYTICTMQPVRLVRKIMEIETKMQLIRNVLRIMYTEKIQGVCILQTQNNE